MPWTTRIGHLGSSAVIGVSNFSAETVAMEWPWTARMRKWDGSEEAVMIAVEESCSLLVGGGGGGRLGLRISW